MCGRLLEEISTGANEAQCDFILGRDVNDHITSEHLNENAKQLQLSQLKYYLIKTLNSVVSCI